MALLTHAQTDSKRDSTRDRKSDSKKDLKYTAIEVETATPTEKTTATATARFAPGMVLGPAPVFSSLLPLRKACPIIGSDATVLESVSAKSCCALSLPSTARPGAARRDITAWCLTFCRLGFTVVTMDNSAESQRLADTAPHICLHRSPSHHPTSFTFQPTLFAWSTHTHKRTKSACTYPRRPPPKARAPRPRMPRQTVCNHSLPSLHLTLFQCSNLLFCVLGPQRS